MYGIDRGDNQRACSQKSSGRASLPRVRSHAYSDALGPLMLGTGKEAV